MQRTMSMASHAVQSEASRGGYTTAGAQSDRMHERELGLSGRRPMGDAASDTSSTRERKFANLLGGGSESGSDRDISPAQARSVGHRLYYNGCGREKVKQDQLREERERLLLAEMAQMTQRPNITARARSKMSKGAYFADHATLWSQQRDNRLRKVAQEVAQERFAEVRDKPTLNQRSEALLKSAGDYKGPVRHWKEHFDKFSARRMRDATGAAAKAANPASPGGQLDFTPNINANAVRVDVERDISDRLYQESSARQERLRQRAFEQQARDMTDPATGRPLFTPHSLRRAGSPPRRDPYEVSQQLHEESFEAQRRREQRVEAHPDAQHAFKPTINASSEELAKRARKPLYLSRAQRAEEERQRREKIQRARSAEPSPRVGDNVVGGRISVDEFLRRAQRNEMTRAQKLDMIRREQEDRELSECSFQPAISRRSEDIFYASNVSGTPMRSPLEAHMGSPLPTDRGTNYSGPASVARHQQQQGHQQRQQQQQQPGTPLVATARQSASPVRASPTPSGHKSPRFGGSGRYGAGGGNAADDFAALMAASGLGGAGGSPVPSHGGAAARGSVPAGSSPNAAAAAARRQPPPPSAADMTANTDLAAAPSPVVRRAASLGGASQGPHHHHNASGMGDVDQYIAAFESQMYSVLEEWRKLEEV